MAIWRQESQEDIDERQRGLGKEDMPSSRYDDLRNTDRDWAKAQLGLEKKVANDKRTFFADRPCDTEVDMQLLDHIGRSFISSDPEWPVPEVVQRPEVPAQRTIQAVTAMRGEISLVISGKYETFRLPPHIAAAMIAMIAGTLR